MTNVDVDASIVDALLDLGEDVERVPRVLLLSGSRSESRSFDSSPKRVLGDADRETLRGESALRVQLQGLVEVLGGADKLGLSSLGGVLLEPLVLGVIGWRFSNLASVEVGDEAGGAEGVDVVAVELFEGGEGELASGFERRGFDEEVGVEGAKLGMGGSGGEGFFDEGVGTVELGVAILALGREGDESEASFGC